MQRLYCGIMPGDLANESHTVLEVISTESPWSTEAADFAGDRAKHPRSDGVLARRKRIA